MKIGPIVRLFALPLCLSFVFCSCQRVVYKTWLIGHKIKYRKSSIAFRSLKNDARITFKYKRKLFDQKQKRALRKSFKYNFPRKNFADQRKPKIIYFFSRWVKGDEGCDGLYIYSLKGRKQYVSHFLYIINNTATFFTDDIEENKRLLENLRNSKWYKNTSMYEKEMLENKIYMKKFLW